MRKIQVTIFSRREMFVCSEICNQKPKVKPKVKVLNSICKLKSKQIYPNIIHATPPPTFAMCSYTVIEIAARYADASRKFPIEFASMA